MYYNCNILNLQPCHVVYTDFRPTPLQHYIYPSGGDGLHLVVDEKVNFFYFYFLFQIFVGYPLNHYPTLSHNESKNLAPLTF